MKDFQYGMVMLSLAGVLFLIFFGNAIVNGAENQAQPEFLHTIFTNLNDPSPIKLDEIKVICAAHGGNHIEVKTRPTPSGYLLARHDCYKTAPKPTGGKTKEPGKQKA